MMDNIFYKNAAKYWANVPATINGVLAGYGHISNIDINGSKHFLNHILLSNNPPGRNLALDCGSGIGRVCTNLLMPHFKKVDLVDQDEKFLNTAKELIGANNPKLGTIYQIGLQDFEPQKEYDVIWCQWVLGHLDDYDLIAFLDRCGNSLAKNGVIVIKENVTSSGVIEYDQEDSSVTRPYAVMEQIFQAANLRVIFTDLQKDFPDDIYKVHMSALVPNK